MMALKLQHSTCKWIFTLVEGDKNLVTVLCERCGAREFTKLRPGEDLSEDEKTEVIRLTDAFKQKHSTCKTKAN